MKPKAIVHQAQRELFRTELEGLVDAGGVNRVGALHRYIRSEFHVFALGLWVMYPCNGPTPFSFHPILGRALYLTPPTPRHCMLAV